MTAAVRWAVAGVLLFAGGIVEIAVGRAWPGPLWATVPLAALSLLPIALIPARPFVSVLTICAALSLTFTSLIRPNTSAGLIAVLLAGFAAGSRLRGVRRWIALVAVLATPLIAISHSRSGGLPPSPIAFVFAVLLYSVPFALGVLVRNRSDAAAAARAAADAAEANQRLLAELAVRDERERIARTLQQVVTESVRILIDEAERGHAAVATRPAEAASAFVAVERTGQHALAEMRRLLGLLRAVDEHPPTAPQPTLAELGTLVASSAAAGLRPDVHVSGSARPLPDTVELTAYRIIETALANVLTHCGACESTIAVEYTEESLLVRVANPANPSKPAERADRPPGDGVTGLEGAGIATMRQRASLVGGRLEVQRSPDGEFVIEATLPLAQSAASAQAAPSVRA